MARFPSKPGKLVRSPAGSRRRPAVLALLACLAMAAGTSTACLAAGDSERRLDLTVRPPDLHLRQLGPLELTLSQSGGLGEAFADGQAFGEISLKAGAVGLSLRPENNRLKPDVFYDLSGWRLRTRIVSGDSPLEIEGMVVRAAHALPLFGSWVGAADLP